MINDALEVMSIFEVVFADEVRRRKHAPGYVMKKENYSDTTGLYTDTEFLWRVTGHP